MVTLRPAVHSVAYRCRRNDCGNSHVGTLPRNSASRVAVHHYHGKRVGARVEHTWNFDPGRLKRSQRDQKQIALAFLLRHNLFGGSLLGRRLGNGLLCRRLLSRRNNFLGHRLHWSLLRGSNRLGNRSSGLLGWNLRKLRRLRWSRGLLRTLGQLSGSLTFGSSGLRRSNGSASFLCRHLDLCLLLSLGSLSLLLRSPRPAQMYRRRRSRRRVRLKKCPHFSLGP